MTKNNPQKHNRLPAAQLLEEVARHLTAEVNLEAFLQRAATAALALCGATTVGVFLYDIERGTLKLHSTTTSGSGPGLSEAALTLAEQAIGSGLAMTHNDQRAPDLAASAAAASRRLSSVAVPIPTNGANAGALVIEAVSHAATTEEMSRVRLLAQLVGIGLYQSRMLDAERQQRRLAEALFDSTAALNSSLQLDEVLDRILNDVRHVVPHDAAHILLIEGQEAHVVRSRGYHELGLHQPLVAKRFQIAAVPQLQHILETDRPLAVPDTGVSAHWVNLPEEQWIRSYAGAPIRLDAHVAGFLSLDSATPGFFTSDHAHWLQAFADQAALALRNASLHRTIQTMARTDELTGLLNRHGLIEAAQVEIMRSQRTGRPLAVAMADIDQFKLINNQHGHEVGDEVMRMVANHFRLSLRATDVIARVGGDELFAILPETDLSSAVALGERLRAQLCSSPIQTTAGDLSATVSIGISALSATHSDLAGLLRSADRALYNAKAGGRDRVSIDETDDDGGL